MRIGRLRLCALAMAADACVLFFHAGTRAQGNAAPRYKFDPDFPKPLRARGKLLEQLSKIP